MGVHRGWRGLIADVATHEASCAHAICEKVVAPLKQENLKLRHKLAEAVSTISTVLQPEISRLRAETLILLSSQTVIRSDAEAQAYLADDLLRRNYFEVVSAMDEQLARGERVEPVLDLRRVPVVEGGGAG